VTEPTTTIVLIESDPQIRRFVRRELQDDGMTAFDAQTGEQGLREIITRKADLLIMELTLPDRDGLDVIRNVRTWSEMPIVVLSAKDGEADKVAAFNAGADDYLTKPFGVAELIARVRVHLKRRNCSGHRDSPIVRFGVATVDLSTRQVTRNGKSVHLTPTEYRLLAVLLRNSGRALPLQQLLRDVWGPSRQSNTHYLRIYIGNLRHKLERDAKHPEHLVTVVGMGYGLMGVQ
jgi:two-component system KDP operon response regulator KdpE